MFESWIQGAVLKVLWNLLREMPLRSIWDLRKQRRMPLLQGPQELQGRSQVPLMHQYITSSMPYIYIYMAVLEFQLFVPTSRLGPIKIY